MHDDTSHWALPLHSTCSALDNIWRSQQCQTILTEFFLIVHIWISLNFVRLLSISSRSQAYHYLLRAHIIRGDNWHISWFDKNVNTFFAGTVEVSFYKLACNLALCRPIYTRFRDLGHVSRSQMCQFINCTVFLDSFLL